MESELRQLIVSKCRARGFALEHLAEVANCGVTELKGFQQGLFILPLPKITRLIRALSITDAEIVSAVGAEAALRIINSRDSDTA